MLVLNRRPGETICIGENIRLTVLEIRGNVIRLGIVAPKEVPVNRGEVHAALHPSQTAPEPDVSGEG